MPDEHLRELERAVLADPYDQVAHERLYQARRRAGRVDLADWRGPWRGPWPLERIAAIFVKVKQLAPCCSECQALILNEDATLRAAGYVATVRNGVLGLLGGPAR